MNNKYFISDLHFYHKNIIKFEGRPFDSVEDMNNKLIENWNSTVKKNDDIYILGDFSFGNQKLTLELLQKLNGKKFLIRGNHDHVIDKNPRIYSEFEWVKDYYVLKYNNLKFILFHFPIQVWNCQHYGSIHLYGHVHGNTKTNHPMILNLKNSFNVSADVLNFSPINIDDIILKLCSKNK